jgi:hypothetical protein
MLYESDKFKRVELVPEENKQTWQLPPQNIHKGQIKLLHPLPPAYGTKYISLAEHIYKENDDKENQHYLFTYIIYLEEGVCFREENQVW